MGRPTRLDIEGGWYHVVNRGIEKRTIFRGAAGYEHFIALLIKLRQRFGIRLHGYVLMPNHYHLQVETPKANLSRAIQWLNVSYSIWFNTKASDWLTTGTVLNLASNQQGYVQFSGSGHNRA